jgi:hypothetical protein
MAERKTFLLRLPPGLWEELRRWADADLRSVNGQIEYLLREAVRRRRREKDDKHVPPPTSDTDKSA